MAEKTGLALAVFEALKGSGGGGTTGITDVQVNGTSVVTGGVANITPSDLAFVQTVSGTTPTITALAGVQYVCGECATLDITLPASGIVDVVFESGSTPTVLTVTPPTGVTSVLWPDGFDPTSLDASTIYEINILDGRLAEVGKWATT